MRKVTAQIKAAFEAQTPRTVGNTSTDGQSVWLHCNKIVERRENGEVWATLAGWATPTTRERVNGITGLRFHQVSHESMLDGRPADPSEWFKA